MPDYIPPPAAHGVVVHQTKAAAINYVAAIFAATGSFLFGYDSGIVGSVISDAFEEFHKYFNYPSEGVKGAIVSLFAAGAFFGALMAGYTADRLGRKRTIQIGATIAIIGCTIQTAAVKVGMLIAGRFIAGWSIGVLSMIVPVYQAEISPPHTRGLLSGWTQLMIGWGFFVANWVGFGCGHLNNNGQWRIPLAIQIVPAIFLLFGMFLLPFSPRWLAKQGRLDESRATLLRLHGGSSNARADVVDAEFQEMLTQIEWERENLSTKFSDLWATKPNWHRALCGMLVQAMCQWTGVNVGAYFGPTIYQSLGFGGNKSLLINSLSSVFSLIVTFIFITFMVDKLGRRKPLIIGPVVMAICLAWQAAIGKKFSNPSYHDFSTGIAGVASFFCFSWAFSWSFGPVSWIYQAEVFPMNLRALGGAVSTASNWLNNVIIGQVTPIGLKKLGYRYFFVFVATNLSNAVVSYFLFPETKNKTLEEIGLLFGDTNVRVMPGMEGVRAGVTGVATDDEKDVKGTEVEHMPTLGHK